MSDDNGGVSSASIADLDVANANPTANAGGPYSGTEGSAISLSGSGDDPGNNDDAGLTYAWSVVTTGIDVGGTCSFSPGNTAQNPTITCTDDSQDAVGGVFKVSLIVSDDDGGVSSTSTANLTVSNDVPVIGTISAPLAPVAVGPNNVTVTWDFTDPGSDTWTCQVEWDTGLGFSSATYFATKSCDATTSLAPGLYTVRIKVADDDGGEDIESLTTYIVVYDPSGGFVTGGGWIMSPAGAYSADLSLAGKATFGFVSKYERNKTLPQGNTEFQFHAASMEFKSTSYEWLVVAGTRAQYKGDGMLNGVAGYGFLLTAIDGGSTSGGVNPDKFRIKIVHKATSTVVYDNQPGSLEDSPDATGRSGGSIVIHTRK